MRRGTEAFSLSGWGSFAVPLAFYAATLTPGVAFWDIGEMQTVPYVLGIPHPTGFPLFLFAGWLAGHAPIMGDPAWRISLLCAVASAGSAWLLWALVSELTQSALLGLAAALVFASGDIVWTRAVRADVHDLALLCSAAAIVAAYRAGRSPFGSPHLGCAALALGLGLATHPIALFAWPCVLALAWPALARATSSERLRAAALAVAPLALYAYFPLRSAFVQTHGLDPGFELGLSGSALFDDGSPSTPGHFWSYVSGSTFRPESAVETIVSLAGFVRALDFAARVLTREFSPPLLAFAALGFAIIAWTDRRLALGFFVLALAGVSFAANYRVEVDTERYALPLLWTVVCCGAIGVRGAGRTLLRGRTTLATAFCSTMLLATLLPTASYAYADVRERTTFDDARDIGPEIARRTPDGSLLIATWSFATPLIYDRYVVRTFGMRRIVCGWPPAYALQLAAWRERFGHVYFVVGSAYDVSRMARPLYVRGRWQLAEMR